MAIFSLSIQSVGRSTHAEGTAGAHIAYISRGGACPSIGAAHMPANSNDASAWLIKEELADRKNARVVDKIMAALPRELTPEQRYKLVEDYVADMTGGRTAYYFAIHERGADADNPHAHIVIRDRDFETGQKIIGFSDSKKQWKERGRGQESATQWIRERWEHHANKALAAAGHSIRIDRRSLTVQRDEALRQGDLRRAEELDRKAQIHIGVRAQKLAEKGLRPDSKGKYKDIDAGRTRAEYNAQIIDFNLEKKLRSRDRTIRAWALFEKEQAQKERDLQRFYMQERRKAEDQERETRGVHKRLLQELGRKRNADATARQRQKQAAGEASRLALAARHREERQAQDRAEKRLLARMRRVLDFTGRYKAQEKDARETLLKRQDAAMRGLERRLTKEQETIRQDTLRAHAPAIEAALADRDKALSALAHHREQSEQRIQAAFQQRAIARHHAKEALETVIKERERQDKRAKPPERPKEPQQEQQKDTDTHKQPLQSLAKKRKEAKEKRPHLERFKANLEAQKQREAAHRARLDAMRQAGRERAATYTRPDPRQEAASQTPHVQPIAPQFKAAEQDNRPQEQARASEPSRHTPQTPLQQDFARQQRDDRAAQIRADIQAARSGHTQAQSRTHSQDMEIG